MKASLLFRGVVFSAGLLVAGALPAQSVLFWAQNGNERVLSSDGTGGNVTDLTPTLTSPWGIAYDGAHVYFSEDSAGKIWKMDPDGGNRTQIASGLNYPRDLAVTATNLYWVNISGGIFRSGLDGTGITTLTTVPGGDFLQGLDVTDSYIYFTDSSNHSVGRTNLDGTGLTTLVTGLNIPYGIQATDQYLYWADLNGLTIQRSNLDGSGVTTIIDAYTMIGKPSGLFVTDDAIYYTAQYNGVYRAGLDGSNLTQLVTGSSDYRFIDGAVAASAVPEPATYALLAGLAVLGLVVWRRVKR